MCFILPHWIVGSLRSATQVNWLRLRPISMPWICCHGSLCDRVRFNSLILEKFLPVLMKKVLMLLNVKKVSESFAIVLLFEPLQITERVLTRFRSMSVLFLFLILLDVVTNVLVCLSFWIQILLWHLSGKHRLMKSINLVIIFSLLDYVCLRSSYNWNRSLFNLSFFSLIIS